MSQPAPMKAILVMCATTLAMGSILVAQSKSTTLAKIYIGSDGLAHVVDDAGKDTAIQKERNQAKASAPKLSADKQTAGWLVEEENCCTSYTIPIDLVIYRAGKKRVLGDGLMIYDWCFVSGGRKSRCRLAPSTG